MKTIITLILFLFGCNMNAQNNFSSTNAKAMLKAFYTEYITESSKFPTNYEKLSQIREKYCTKELLLEIEKLDLDYDLILNAQDTELSTLESLSIKEEKNNLFIVSYIFYADKVEVKLYVKLIHNKYKIVKIEL